MNRFFHTLSHGCCAALLVLSGFITPITAQESAEIPVNETEPASAEEPEYRILHTTTVFLLPGTADPVSISRQAAQAAQDVINVLF